MRGPSAIYLTDEFQHLFVFKPVPEPSAILFIALAGSAFGLSALLLAAIRFRSRRRA